MRLLFGPFTVYNEMCYSSTTVRHSLAYEPLYRHTKKTHKEVFTRIFNTIYHDFSTEIHSFHDLYTLNTSFAGAAHATRSSETIECDSIIFITFQPITHKPIRIETPSDKKTYAENCDSIKKVKQKSNRI